MQIEQIKVTTLGFDPRSIKTLELAFTNKLKGACSISNAEEAQVVLLNLDAANIAEIYTKSDTQFKTIPAIGISKTNNDEWDIAQIQIPISVDALAKEIALTVRPQNMTERQKITDDKIARAMAAIDANKVASGLNKKIKNDTSNVVTKRAVPNKSDEMCFDIERFLLWTILEAERKIKETDQFIVVNCLGDRQILINLKQKEVLTDLSDNQLRTLAIVPIDDNLSSPVEATIHSMNEIESLNMFSGRKARTISHESFMWDLGLMTSRGRIPMEMMGSDRQYLIRWPNVTRLHLCNNTLQIIAYWVRQPCGLYELNEKTGIPLQDIFSVFTAAYSAGLAGTAKRNSDQLMAAEDVHENTKRGLFSSIVNRLRKLNRKAA